MPGIGKYRYLRENDWLMGKIKMMLSGLLGSVFAARTGNEGFRSVDADEFEKIIREGGVQLVDVRRVDEYAAGHIPGTVLIDVTRDDFLERAIATLDRGKPVAVYCRSGKRSAVAARLLVKNGYRVVNLRGGWLEWSGKGKASEPAPLK